MTDLSDLVPALQRLVATPGTFATFYPDTASEDLVGSLMDGFAEAQLDGFFVNPMWVLDLDAETITPDLPVAGRALVQIYAAANFVTAMVINLKNQVRYEAKGAIYETVQAATILTTLLKQFQDRKRELKVLLEQQNAAAAFYMADQYLIKSTSRYAIAGMSLEGSGHSVGAIGNLDPYGF